MGPSESLAWPRPRYLWLLQLNATWSWMPLRFVIAGPPGPYSLSTLFVGTSLFGRQFESFIEEATHNWGILPRLVQELFRALQGLESANNHRSERQLPRLLPLQPIRQVLQALEIHQLNIAGLKTANKRSGGAPAQSQAQQGARKQRVSNKSWWLSCIMPSYPTHSGGGVGGDRSTFLDILG